MGFFDNLFGKFKQDEPKPQKSEERILLTKDQLIEKLKPFKRMAYIPLIGEGAATFDAKSKMGGYPYLRNEEDWPRCPNCNNHMQLFIQLSMSQLPEKKSEGLVQLFYCTNSDEECESANESYEAFSKGSVCRRITISGDSASIDPEIEELYPEMVINRWQTKDDYPDRQEYEDLGILMDDPDGELYEIIEEEGLVPCTGDKLFGWPYWVQSVRYPDSQKIGTKMELLFQIDSEVNLPYMFGDSGIAYLTRAPTDEDELAFRWDCY